MLFSLIFAAALTAQLQHTFDEPAVGRGVAFTPDSQVVKIASADGTIRFWRVADQKTHPHDSQCGRCHKHRRQR